MNEHRSAGPLEGVRVIDLTTVVMGPFATRILGDMGADVIRVESPMPDMMREFDPKRSPAMSGFTLNLNRNKRSVVLDLKSDAGHRAIVDLVASADVFVSNLRPVALAKLGLADADLRTVRADLVYCSAVGFATGGPRSGQAAYDDVIQAVSGTASMFAWTSGQPALAPTILADKISALHIAYAISASLHHRAVTGEGDTIEVPMAEVMAAFNLVEHLNGHTFEPKQGEFSYARVRTPLRRPRRSADGWIVILPYTDANYRAFFGAVDRADLIDDERYSSVNARIRNVEALYGLVEAFAGMKTTEEWLEICEAASIPCAPVVSLEHIEDDPHFAAVGLIEIDEHPTEGTYRVVHDPVRFASRQGSEVRRHAPRHGADTAEVMSAVGWSGDDIAKLTQS